jgi:hypothetical protein
MLVVAMDACPSQAWTVTGSTPFASHRHAAVWRRSCLCRRRQIASRSIASVFTRSRSATPSLLTDMGRVQLEHLPAGLPRGRRQQRPVVMPSGLDPHLDHRILRQHLTDPGQRAGQARLRHRKVHRIQQTVPLNVADRQRHRVLTNINSHHHNRRGQLGVIMNRHNPPPEGVRRTGATNARSSKEPDGSLLTPPEVLVKDYRSKSASRRARRD